MKSDTDSGVGYYHSEACDAQEFQRLIDQDVRVSDVPNACDIQKNIPIYDAAVLRPVLEDFSSRRQLMSEWARVLSVGAGTLVVRGTYADQSVLDEATGLYENIIAAETLTSVSGADHFAAAGANDRIWNALQKLCEASPDVFLRYFANDVIAAVCEAWLGPQYQMTAQVNLVHPGGAAQHVHRDYHLGFATSEMCALYPAHVHELSPRLTLQAAIAHCDMPLESGPTKLLPFSQTYAPGYAAWRRQDFQDIFEKKSVQLALNKGDTLYFNPALFHAAGANHSDHIHRFVNLLQVSSAFGRAMETLDRDKMCRFLYPVAALAKAQNDLTHKELDAAIAATAEGYAFPTNLDRHPPTDGLAPESQAAFFKRALNEGHSFEAFCKGLDQMKAAQRA